MIFTFKGKVRFSRKDVFLVSILPPLLVFIALMVMIAISWRTSIKDVATVKKNTINSKTVFVKSTLSQKFSIYEHALRGGTGLFEASSAVNRREWRSFVDALGLEQRHPGILGVGFVKIIPAASASAYERQIRATDLSTFRIFPASRENKIATTIYMVPTADQKGNDRTSPAIGFDMYSDKVRKKAVERAVITGGPVFSDLVDLIEGEAIGNRGFLLLMPLYKKGSSPSSEAERLASIDGVAYVPFSSQTIFSVLFSDKDENFGFTIYEGRVGNSSIMYQSRADLNESYFSEVKREKLSFYKQNWVIVYEARDELVPEAIRERPLSTAFGGTLFAFALAALIYLLIQRRTRSLAYAEEKRLEQAKDELLSLASHQLRTPATAVKQYVSMVKDGFAGKLNKEQRDLLKLAYESNDRQLTIVDDLLHVARIDAGQATPKPERMDLVALLRSVVRDLKSDIAKRNQQVKLVAGKKPIFIMGDPYYLRMIFENLLSNASKYSYENTGIKINIEQTPEMVNINFADQGVGIKSEDFPQIFQRFSRIANELTRQTPGSGIGLYLAKRLASLHGGDITFISKIKKGSIFTLTLPKLPHKK